MMRADTAPWYLCEEIVKKSGDVAKLRLRGKGSGFVGRLKWSKLAYFRLDFGHRCKRTWNSGKCPKPGNLIKSASSWLNAAWVDEFIYAIYCHLWLQDVYTNNETSLYLLYLTFICWCLCLVASLCKPPMFWTCLNNPRCTQGWERYWRRIASGEPRRFGILAAQHWCLWMGLLGFGRWPAWWISLASLFLRVELL